MIFQFPIVNKTEPTISTMQNYAFSVFNSEHRQETKQLRILTVMVGVS